MSSRYSKLAAGVALAISGMPLMAAELQGQVLNQQGSPIKNAQVLIYGTNKQASTNEQGQFQLKNLEPGHYHLHVSADDHVQQDLELEVKPQMQKQVYTLQTSSIENIVITAGLFNRSLLESSIPASVISKDELSRMQTASLGETLKNEPGIHSSYFGPASSSPVIRGMDGPRVKIVQNGLDTGDASRVGPDHAVATETATATQVEVLRGPATLLYGSGAIGGVVNVVDQRIPTQKVDGLEGNLDARHESVADGKTFSIDLTGGSGNFAWHFDAFDRDNDDYDIPGEAELESDDHDEEHEDHDEHDHDEHDEHDEESGTLAGSSVDAKGYTFGTSYITDKGYLGVSFGRLESYYGIPGHAHHHEEDEEEHEEHSESAVEGTFADLEQDRVQLIGSLNSPFAYFTKADIKLAYTDYQHQEIEDGELGTSFKNDSLVGRLELFHTPINEWQGVLGLQYSSSDFEAVGDEAFTPPVETDSIALFLLEEKRFGDVTINLGARVEKVDLTPDDQTLPSLDYTPVSFSAGGIWQMGTGYSLALSLAHSERAPSASELYANGEHISTQNFEVGGIYELEAHDDHFHLEQGEGLDKETANNLDITLRKFGGSWGATFSIFYNQVDDYIFQQNTGFVFEGEHDHHDEDEHEEHEEHHDEEEHHEHEEGLPVYAFAQQDATLYGFEAELNIPLHDLVKLDIFADYTRGKLDQGGYIPRMPPLRFGAALNAELDNWHLDLSATRYAKQTKVAEQETETKGYVLVDASVNYYLDAGDGQLNFYLKASNLFDKEARVHNSFLKDRAPLPGRNLVLGVNYSF